MKPPKQKSIKVLQAECDAFNAKHPIGSSVHLRLDSGQSLETKVTHAAYVAGGHSAVAFFEGVSGYYLISHASPIATIKKKNTEAYGGLGSEWETGEAGHVGSNLR